MSKNESKRYQLWCQYNLQDGNNPRNANEYSLVFETDDDFAQLFIKRYELEKQGDKVLITKRVNLVVDLA